MGEWSKANRKYQDSNKIIMDINMEKSYGKIRGPVTNKKNIRKLDMQ